MSITAWIAFYVCFSEFFYLQLVKSSKPYEGDDE